MIEWNDLTIGELVDKGEADLQTGPFGTQLKASDYVDEGTPVINVRNVGFGNIRLKDLEYLDEAMVEKLHVHQLKRDDIVFARKGAVERHALIDGESEGWIQGSDCLRLRISSDRVSRQFLSYYFLTSAHQYWMEAVCSFGATMSSLNQDIVKHIAFPNPPVAVQEKVVAVLKTYDDAIGNCDRRIQILETTAEQTFREWFVRMRFPGFKSATFQKGVPSDWAQTTLGKTATMVMGQSPKSEFYNEIGDGLPFNQGVGTYGRRFPKRKTFCSIDGRRAHEGDILFSVRAPVGRLNIADCEMIVGRGLAALRHKDDLNSYLFYLLKVAFSNEDIIGNGAIFNSVGKDELANFKIFGPTSSLVERFDAFASPIDEQINELTRSIALLTESRNSLLRRLIAGRLDVADLQIRGSKNCDAAAEELRDSGELVHA